MTALDHLIARRRETGDAYNATDHATTEEADRLGLVAMEALDDLIDHVPGSAVEFARKFIALWDNHADPSEWVVDRMLRDARRVSGH